MTEDSCGALEFGCDLYFKVSTTHQSMGNNALTGAFGLFITNTDDHSGEGTKSTTWKSHKNTDITGFNGRAPATTVGPFDAEGPVVEIIIQVRRYITHVVTNFCSRERASTDWMTAAAISLS